MKTEIIIAARGELPVNLTRTVRAASKAAPVCVVFDGSESGNKPTPEIKKLARVIEITGRSKGCGWARHKGIMSSDADLIVICDGHMTFPHGWLNKIEDYHRKRHKHLTCCRMQSLAQDATPLPGEVYGGAYVAYKAQEPGTRYHALQPKWMQPVADPGPVPCVMGACYAFRRTWYNKIGGPLQILKAWGGDEEILSLATHIMGGKVELLDVTVGHIYAAAHQGRVMDDTIRHALWENRYAVLDALPMPGKEREDLKAWMRQSRTITRIPQFDPRADVKKLAAVLARGSRSWQDLKDAGIVRLMTDAEKTREAGRDPVKVELSRSIPKAPEKDTTQVVVRHDPVCNRCGARNSFRQIAGRRNTGAFGIACTRCTYCGHKAQFRFI